MRSLHPKTMNLQTLSYVLNFKSLFEVKQMLKSF